MNQSISFKYILMEICTEVNEQLPWHFVHKQSDKLTNIETIFNWTENII